MIESNKKYHWYSDSSFWTLAVANVYAILTIEHNAISNANVMLIFWFQSVIIGIFTTVQMLMLDDFSGDGMGSDLEKQKGEKKEKYMTAGFFTFHYNFFHAGYLLFIYMMFKENHIVIDWRAIAPIAGMFFVHHCYSFFRARRELVKADPEPIMGQAYGRIVPMHVAIIFGSGKNPLLFLLLKTGIDLLAHSSKQRVITAKDLKKPILVTTPEKARRNVFILLFLLILGILLVSFSSLFMK